MSGSCPTPRKRRTDQLVGDSVGAGEGVARPDPGDPQQLDLLADTRTARLAVIDYAETRREQLADVLPVLAMQASGEHPGGCC